MTVEYSSLPYDPFLLQDAKKIKINGSASNLISRDFGSHTGDPLLNSTELTNQMHMSQDNHKFDLPPISSQNLESCDLINWSVSTLWLSTLWSPLCSNQGQGKGCPEVSSSPKELSVSAKRLDSDLESTYNVVGMLEKMKLDESSSYKHHSEYQSPVYEQIRANQLCKLKQEQIASLKEKEKLGRENYGHVSQQFQKKDQRAVLQRPSLAHSYHQKHAIFSETCGSSGTYSNTSTNGTGVFLPRGRSNAQSDSNRRRTGSGKGYPTVLIPARVVQALQLQFDQIAATSGPKSPPAFPPLHDVLVSNRDGMYSLQKRQSRKKPAHIHNEMIIPREWTY